MSFDPRKIMIAVAVAACAVGASAAPVVVQKGSTAQYIYIPAGSVPTGGAGGGANDGATAAKQFCKKFISQDTTFTVPKDLMLDPTVKFAGVAIGGGSGYNSSRAFADPDTGVVTSYKYASAGAGGSTAVLVNGVPVAVAAGADAPTGENASGLTGARVTVPEFTATRSGAGTQIQIIIGGGGGAGGPDWDYGQYGRAADLNSGTGARGFYGGGGGARIVSSTSLSPVTWPTPARGGTGSLGGAGAAAPIRGDSRSNGTMGGSMVGGNGTGGAGSRAPNTGRLMFGQAVVSGWMQIRYEYISHLPSNPYEQNVAVGYNSTLTLSAVSSSSLAGPSPIDEASMLNFGVGSTNPSSSGTAGVVYLYYSAPTCNLIPY